jgi:hypothetical protein
MRVSRYDLYIIFYEFVINSQSRKLISDFGLISLYDPTIQFSLDPRDCKPPEDEAGMKY